MYRSALTALGAIFLFVASSSSPGSVQGATQRHEFSCVETYQSNDDGTFWIDEGVAHLRGAIYRYAVTGDAECAGLLAVTVNFNLDFATASGVLWGTAHKELQALDGGFDMRWTAHWTNSNPLAPDATDIWAGQYGGRGFGAVEGWQVRAELLEANHALVLEHGYAFAPGE